MVGSVEGALPARAGQLTDVRIATGLSLLPAKRELFALDTHFREAWPDLEPARPLLHRLALVVFKPDALVGRRIGPCLELLGEHGFRVAAARTFTYDRLSIRETWRYQFNIASRDRIDVVDVLLTVAPSLLVVLRDERPLDGCPASVRLGSLKGPSEPALRRAGQLRYELGVLTTLFNFVHTSDEPADIVRELGVLLGADERRQLAEELCGGHDRTAQALRMAAELEARHPAHDLDCAAALARLEAAPQEAVRRSAQAARERRPGAWRELLAAIPMVDPWDALAVATATIDCNVPGLEPMVEGVAGDAWVRRWQAR